MKDQIIDLTKICQESSQEIIKELDHPGKYRLPVREYNHEGWGYIEDHDVDIDKVIFCRHGHFQMIHTVTENIFEESGWAYYNSIEHCWKWAISIEEVMDEVIDEYGFIKGQKILCEYWDDED